MVLKNVIVNKNSSVFEEDTLLPPQYMGAHPGKSTDIVLSMQVKQIHTAQHAEYQVATFSFLT
jgi:hypothetical protein